MRKILILLPASVVITLGCSEGARRFFFEIPDETKAAATGEETATPVAQPPAAVAPEPRYASVHQPYAEHQCDACHDAGRQMRVVENLADACGECHQRYFGDAIEHEPVAGGDCGSCHQAHRSQHPRLLKDTVPALCGECHDPDDLGEEGHDVPNVKDCTACHDAHFGSAPYLKVQGPKSKVQGHSALSTQYLALSSQSL